MTFFVVIPALDIYLTKRICTKQKVATLFLSHFHFEASKGFCASEGITTRRVTLVFTTTPFLRVKPDAFYLHGAFDGFVINDVRGKAVASS